MNFYESEACFRIYEEPIIQATLGFPKEVFFSSETRMLSTDTARCRDAITSFVINQWTSRIDPVAYAPILKQLAVIPFAGHSVILPKTVRDALTRRWNACKREDKDFLIRLNTPNGITHSKYALTQEIALVREAIARSEARKALSGAKQPTIEDAALPPACTPIEFLTYDLQRAVDMINSGEVKYEYSLPISDENITAVKAAIADKLNVAFIADRQSNLIRIF